VATLILAIPVTIISKVLHDEAPFQNVPSLALEYNPEAKRERDLETLGSVSDAVGATINVVLDLIPEKDTGKPASSAGSVTNVLTDIGETLSLACTFCSLLSASYGHGSQIASDLDDPANITLEAVSAFYEAFLLWLDLGSFGYMATKYGKVERLRRGDKWTTLASLLLGLGHIGLSVSEHLWSDGDWVEKNTEDSKEYSKRVWRIITDVLMLIPDITPGLRLFEPNWGSEAAILVFDGLAAGSAWARVFV
jgi:hypothetical protein